MPRKIFNDDEQELRIKEKLIDFWYNIKSGSIVLIGVIVWFIIFLLNPGVGIASKIG